MRFPCDEAYERGFCPGGECCGMQPIQRSLVMKHLDDVQCRYDTHGDDSLGRMIYTTEDNHCMFLDRETFQCVIYATRPRLCHEYGTTEKLPCPYIGLDGTLRDRADRRRTKRQMSKHVKGQLQKMREMIYGQ